MEASSKPANDEPNLREKGNGHFQNGQFVDARACYVDALAVSLTKFNIGNSAECAARAVLFSNKAAAELKLDNPKNAITDCREALTLDPLNLKVHYRLACAHFNLLQTRTSENATLSEVDIDEMACSIVVAIGLAQRKGKQALSEGDAMMLKYRAIRATMKNLPLAKMKSSRGFGWSGDVDDASGTRYFENCSTLQLMLPEDVRRIVCIESSMEYQNYACKDSDECVFVLLPNKDFQMPLDPFLPLKRSRPRLQLIGVSHTHVSITASPFTGHALYLPEPDSMTTREVYLARIRFSQGREDSRRPLPQLNAAVAVSPGVIVRMVDCAVVDYPEAGMLIHGGNVEIHRCTFKGLAKQAVEVRQGGSLSISSSVVQKCHKGLMAYGGALKLEVVNCSITDVDLEGIMVAGSFQNAQTRMQYEKFPDGARHTNATSAEAADWGLRQGLLLEASVKDSEIRKCGMFGLSLDEGARVTVAGNLLDQNEPVSVFVKGSTSLFMAANHLAYKVGPYRPKHPQAKAWKAMHLSGVRIGINYGAPVVLRNNCFVGSDPKLAVHEDMQSGSSGMGMNARQLGLWSKPALQIGNTQHECLSDCPSLSQLSHALWQTNTLSELASVGPGESGSFDRYFGLARTSRSFHTKNELHDQYYAVGNCPGFDVSDNQSVARSEDVSPQPECAILFAACGDIRNLLKTVHEMHNRQPGLRIACTLNDSNPAILARAVLMLSLIEDGCSPADLVAFWTNFCLTCSQKDRLSAKLDVLSRGEWPAWLLLPPSSCPTDGCSEQETQDAKLSDALKEVFQAWQSCPEPPSGGLLAMRKREQGFHAELIAASLALSLREMNPEREPVKKPIQREVLKYIESGNLTEDRSAQFANVTLLSAPSLQYNLYWSSSIFRAVQVDLSNPSKSAYSSLLEAVGLQMSSVAKALKSGAVNIALLLGDILESLLFYPQTSPGFDFIDCSNVSDYVSVPAMLQAALAVMKQRAHSRLFLHSQHHNVFTTEKNPNEYLRKCVGMDLDTFHEMLGIELLEVTASAQGSQLHFKWGWKPAISADESGCHGNPSWLSAPYLLLELMATANSFCGFEVGRDSSSSSLSTLGQTAGIGCTSPLTLAHLLHLTCEDEAWPFVQFLASEHKFAKRCKWELQGHIRMHAQSNMNNQSLLKPHSVVAEKVDRFLFMSQLESPQFVVFSASSIKFVPGQLVDVSLVKQVIEAVNFDVDSGKVEFFFQPELQHSVADQQWNLTVCTLQSDMKPVALTQSVGASGMCTSNSDVGIGQAMKWRRMIGGSRFKVHLDEEFFQLRCKGKWHSRVNECTEWISVEVLLPSLVPKEFNITMDVKNGQTLRVECKYYEEKNYSGDQVEAVHELTLPQAVSTSAKLGCKMKMSKNLAIMCARFPKVPS